MLQLKVFYNVSFSEVIFTDQNIQSFEELMEVVRGKIECFRFIPDSELGVQYVDEGNKESNYCGMFVPRQGWKAPTSEPESSAQRE